MDTKNIDFTTVISKPTTAIEADRSEQKLDRRDISYITINNRRYLGNKFKLLQFIRETVDNECDHIDTIFDAFAGTGAVASAFLDKTVITNDILYSNYMAHLTWFFPQKFDKDKISDYLLKYNNLNHIEKDNYMSEIFADTYFSYDTCKKIGVIREDIECNYRNKSINKRERAILITSLLYAMDRIANTCGHYDAYRKDVEINDTLRLSMPKIADVDNNNRCYNENSNKLAPKIKADLVYLDPPYNSRQYSDTYHLLENVARWKKQPVTGVAKKMDRHLLKSDYCTIRATQAFEDLVNKLNARYILMSYNNTGDSSHDRSNARISDSEIYRILSTKGTVKIFSKPYKAFTAGKSSNTTNEERLFLCICNQSKTIPSPLNYTGGKYKLLNQIKPFFPNNIDIFYDLFCGGCSVGINVAAKQNIYNDKNNYLIGLFDTLNTLTTNEVLSNIYKIIDCYGLSNSSKYGYEYYNCNSSKGLASYNREKYIALRRDFNDLKVKDNYYYMMLYVLIVYGFNNQIRFNKSSHFNLPVGKRDFNRNIKKNLVNFLERLKRQDASFLSMDFENIKTDCLTKNSLVYCDPPYLISLASYNEQNLWTELDEKRLLQYLDKLNAMDIKFALSNVLKHQSEENVILANWLKRNDYNIKHLNYSYSNSSYHKRDRKSTSEEVLISNY